MSRSRKLGGDYERENNLVYPVNLAIKVMGQNRPSELYPDDLYGSADYALSQLPVKQAKALEMWFKKSWQASKIAEHLGCTTAEVSKLIDAGIHSLQSPRLQEFFYRGVGQMIAMKGEDLKYMAYAEALFAADDMTEEFFFQKMKYGGEDAKGDGDAMSKFRSCSIDALNVSDTCDRILKKAGIGTIDVLIKKIEKDWTRSTRSFDRRTNPENRIQAILAKYGVKLPDNKNEPIKYGKEAVYALKVEVLRDLGLSQAVIRSLKTATKNGYYSVRQMNTISDVVTLYKATKFNGIPGVEEEEKSNLISVLMLLKINVVQASA